MDENAAELPEQISVSVEAMVTLGGPEALTVNAPESEEVSVPQPLL